MRHENGALHRAVADPQHGDGVLPPVADRPQAVRAPEINGKACIGVLAEAF